MTLNDIAPMYSKVLVLQLKTYEMSRTGEMLTNTVWATGSPAIIWQQKDRSTLQTCHLIWVLAFKVSVDSEFSLGMLLKKGSKIQKIGRQREQGPEQRRPAKPGTRMES